MNWIRNVVGHVAHPFTHTHTAATAPPPVPGSNTPAAREDGVDLSSLPTAPLPVAAPSAPAQPPASQPVTYTDPVARAVQDQPGIRATSTGALFMEDPQPLPDSTPIPSKTWHINQSGMLKELQEQLGSGARIQNQDDISVPNGRVPSEAELTQACGEIAKNPEIPFGYIHDGCYARAHVMCKDLKERGINRAKIFVMAEGGERLQAQNKHMQSTWWYHVAPFTFCETPEGKVEPRVLDPGFSDKPMTPDAWIKAMGTTHVRIDIVNESQYSPRESCGHETDFDANMKPAWGTLKDYSAAFKAMVEA